MKSKTLRFAWALMIAQLVSATQSNVLGQAASQGNAYQQYVPQHLLGLIHAPEVHKELEFTKTQVQKLETFFNQVDGPWFRARILPAEKKHAIIAQVEDQLRNWMQQNASKEQRERLAQLEYRAQGVRMLLRQDLGTQIGLDSSQQTKLAELAKNSNEATQKLHTATMRNEVTDELTKAVASAAQAEQNALQEVVHPEQLKKLWKILGEPFETSNLKRIYPMAPELQASEHWVNSQPFTLKELRGKVVVLHFYAFQCHNCHANFGHYTKWHQEFSNDDVVVLGIQTPETSRERDPQAVRSAAAERKLKFPILIDLESKNWTAWSNTMWPTVYVIDKNGYIRQWWQGELNWKGATGDQRIRNVIDELLAEDLEA